MARPGAQRAGDVRHNHVLRHPAGQLHDPQQHRSEQRPVPARGPVDAHRERRRRGLHAQRPGGGLGGQLLRQPHQSLQHERRAEDLLVTQHSVGGVSARRQPRQRGNRRRWVGAEVQRLRVLGQRRSWRPRAECHDRRDLQRVRCEAEQRNRNRSGVRYRAVPGHRRDRGVQRLARSRSPRNRERHHWLRDRRERRVWGSVWVSQPDHRLPAQRQHEPWDQRNRRHRLGVRGQRHHRQRWRWHPAGHQRRRHGGGQPHPR